MAQNLIYVGILLEVLAAALGTLSKQLIAISEHLKKPWLFHIGAGINIAVGPIVDASAYAFAPQVIVAPFACLDVIFNALTAPYTLRWQNEQLTKVHLIGTLFVATGAALSSQFAEAEEIVYDVYMLEHQLLRPQSVIYFFIELSGIITATILLRKNLMSSMVRGISLGVIAGVLMGNVFFVKGIVSLIRNSISTGSTDAWLRPTPYICLAFAAGGAIVGHMFMRKGLGEYKGVFMVTIFEGAHITAACFSGWVVMSEMSGAPWWRFVCYWACVGLIVCGMLFINTAAANSEISRSAHIASHFVGEEEEKTGFVDGAAPAPMGKTLDDQEDLEMYNVDFNNPLEGDGSPIGGAWDASPRNDVEMDPLRCVASPPPSPAKPERLDSGDTESNVSTSTPEGDSFEAQNGHENGGGREPAREPYQPPVFLG